jgi:hypothetical protein
MQPRQDFTFEPADPACAKPDDQITSIDCMSTMPASPIIVGFVSQKGGTSLDKRRPQ